MRCTSRPGSRSSARSSPWRPSAGCAIPEPQAASRAVASMATRLPAEERKKAVLDCACGILSTGSYRGTTTAEIAPGPGQERSSIATSSRSGTCTSRSWKSPGGACASSGRRPSTRSPIEALGRRHGPGVPPGQGPEGALCRSLGPGAGRGERRPRDPQVPQDPDERRAQLRGGCHPPLATGGRISPTEASAEAWIFIAIGLLGTVGRRVGGLIQEDFPTIIAERRRWMTA